MGNYSENIEAIRAARKSKDDAEHELYALKLQHFDLLKKKKKFEAKEVSNGTNAIDDPTEAIENVKRKIAAQRDLLNRRIRTIEALVAKLFTPHTPQQLIEEWDDQTPILLLPLRIETRFKIDNEKKELWVRVFPDEIAVNTHEEVLTEQEVTYGQAYWKALWAATDKQKKKEAWSMLANTFGGNRSAWVALQTKPVNWNEAPSVEDDLEFPTHDLTKSSQWTKAPHTCVLPDRFVLLAYRDNELITPMALEGNPIDDVVILGPAPLGDDGTESSIKQDETNGNRIVLGQDFEWVSNFDMAVAKGLGFKIDLSKLDPLGITRGYDQLIVVGLKHTANTVDGQKLVEDLIQNHHYSKKGFSLVRQGTPTNNTEESDAGFTKSDPLNEQSYPVETGDPLFDPVTAKRDELTDGQRLAELLGIGYAPLQYIANSNAKDHTEASAMNAALYATTIGYFMNSMLQEVVPSADLKKLRYHFKRYVTGRGPLPAIRVGNQPYGILVTSAFPTWSYGKRDPFLTKVHSIVSYFETQWQKLIPSLAHIGKEGDAGKNLMEILGLHPTSTEFFQRVGYSFDYLKNLDEFAWGGQYGGDTIKMLIEQSLATYVLRQMGYRTTNDNGAPKPTPLLLQLIFQHYHTTLDRKNLIDGLPTSETSTIKYYDEAREKHYIHWLIDNAGDSKKLETKDFGSVTPPNNLLFMLLLNAVLIESSNSIFSFLEHHDIIAKELVQSRKFMNMSTAPSVSPWEVFQAPVNRVVKESGISQTLFEYVHGQPALTTTNSHFAGDLLDQREALNILKDMSTASLERTMVEHIDTLTYRLDAWQTSLFARRLEEQRNVVEGGKNRKEGIYLGAYGYLEEVKPGNSRKKISETVLPEALREQKDNLYTEQANGGFVHAPSLNHATAAAILRNGYLTHASAEEKEMLSVNLSSERVRRALYLIEGIRNGQTVEVLLGYQFERGLHDWTTRQAGPVFLNHLIPAFRKDYPIKRTKVPQAGKVTGPEETIDDFSVVNGLSLAQTSKAAPFISETLTTEQIEAVKKERDGIQNTLDALRDVLTAESAYQLAMGNFERAAAVVRSMADGNLPPDIEVINTARGTNLSLTNRMVVHFDTTITTAPPLWSSIPMTLRATTEPSLNHWIGTVLGDPGNIRCRVAAYDAEGNILTDGGSNIEGSVTLKDLGIQPIDFMYLVRAKTEAAGTSELEARIRLVFAQRETLADDVIIKIEFINNGESSPNPAIRSFGEILPFADIIRNIVSGSRPVHARDYSPASKTLVASADNPENIEVTDLQSRVEFIYDDLDPKFTTLKTAWDNAVLTLSDITITALRSAIKIVADAGFQQAFPHSSTGSLTPQADSLFAQAESLLKRFDKIREDYAESLTTINKASTTIRSKIALLTSVSKMLLGDDYVVIPRFNFTNIADVTQSYSSRAQLLTHATTTRNNPLVVEEWLHGVSLVRPKMHQFGLMKIFHDGLNNTFLTCEPIQLPYRDKDSWLGVEFPDGTTIDHDTLSMILYTPQGFDPTQAQCGLLLDDWVEVVPQKEEVTGLTFNFNQPNSVPPQAILMAVTPQLQGSWKWDNLIDTIRDTFHRAKIRAVEPDQLDLNASMVNKFLPGIISEFSTGKSSISLDLAFLVPILTASLVQFYTPKPQPQN